MQRTKGKVFERRIAALLRQAIPAIAAHTHRSIQSRGPEASDVIAPGLWIECQDARAPTPEAKLLQAERDADAAQSPALRVAVTHLIRARSIEVTMRVPTMLALLAPAFQGPSDLFNMFMVTVDIDTFVALYAQSEVLEIALAEALAGEVKL